MASYQDIIAACPGIDPKQSKDSQFLARVQSAGLSLEEIERQWQNVLRLKDIPRASENSLNKQDLKAMVNQSHPRGGGFNVYDLEAETFESAISEVSRKKGIPRHQAARFVNKHYPELRQQCVEEANGIFHRYDRGGF